MLPFSTLVQKQRVLIGLVPSPTDLEALNMAALAEAGEIAQAIKGSWAWWTRYGVPFSNQPQALVLAELADAMHFAVLGFILQADYASVHIAPRPDVAEAVYETFWVGDLSPLSTSLQHVAMPSSKSNLAGLSAVKGVVHAVRRLGYTREQFGAAYLAKHAENVRRATEKFTPLTPQETPMTTDTKSTNPYAQDTLSDASDPATGIGYASQPVYAMSADGRFYPTDLTVGDLDLGCRCHTAPLEHPEHGYLFGHGMVAVTAAVKSCGAQARLQLRDISHGDAQTGDFLAVDSTQPAGTLLFDNIQGLQQLIKNLLALHHEWQPGVECPYVAPAALAAANEELKLGALLEQTAEQHHEAVTAGILAGRGHELAPEYSHASVRLPGVSCD